jgi:hypothetical protein
MFKNAIPTTHRLLNLKPQFTEAEYWALLHLPVPSLEKHCRTLPEIEWQGILNQALEKGTLNELIEEASQYFGTIQIVSWGNSEVRKEGSFSQRMNENLRDRANFVEDQKNG